MNGKFTTQTDDRAVSPVIGVILMVAITVILAAVIGFFVLDLGSDQQSTPQASFEVNDDGAVIMTGGDTLEGDNLEIVDGSSTSSVSSGSITAGTEVHTGLSGSGTVQVTWSDGGQSATLASIEYDV